MRRTFQIIASAFILITTPLIAATDWNCRNNDFEISCSSKKCKIATSFTPMHVSFDLKGNMSVCAYSGCWEGVGKVTHAVNYTIIAGHNLKFSTSGNNQGDFLIAIDTNDKVAVIKGFGYAMPMTCK